MGHVDVLLLGAPRIEREGEPVAVDTRKAIALLAYLAVTGRPHTRDALCNLLWPESDDQHARGALRRTLSTLRKALGPELLEARGDRVALAGDGLRVDVREFKGLLGDDPEAAVELYAGDFLAGFALRDSVNFDDWQYFETDSLRRELAEALERLVDERAARGDYDGAILLARRWLGLNALHEPAHRRLIELYALRGERAAALRQYRECVRILNAELGVAPIEETTALYRAVQENRLTAPRTAERPPPQPAGTDAPSTTGLLVGRGPERDALVSAWENANVDGRLMVLEGETGIGKSRLARVLVEHVGTAGGRAISIRCYEDEEELAYAPVADALRQALAMSAEPVAEALAETARLLPEAGPSSPLPLDSPGAQTRFFDALAAVLTNALAGKRPGLLFVDDAHWADDASLDFLSYLYRRLASRPLVVLLAWRSEAVVRKHRLRRLAEGSGRGAGATLLHLRRLGPAEVSELAAALAPEVDPTRVFEESEGVPLLVVELCRPGVQGEPAGLREILLSRLATLGEVAAQVLSAASVIGRPFDADLLRAASGRTEEETVAALEELGAHGVVAESGSGYDFRHEQLRVVAYEETSLARRRLLHRRVAQALERAPGGAGQLAGAVARHYQTAGRDFEAARFHRLAGEHAQSLYANADALAHFRAALALDQEEAAHLHAAIGYLETLTGDYEGALASYEAAAAAASPAEVAAIEHEIGVVHLRRGEWDLAAGHLRSALEGSGDDAVLAARASADLSLATHHAGDSAGAAELAAEALAMAERSGDRRTRAQALNLLGLLAASEGRGEEAGALLEESLALTSAPEDAEARVAALNNLALTAREDDLDRALALTTEALRLCSQRGDRHREAALENNIADLLRDAGRTDEAMEHLKRAVAGFAAIGEDAVAQPEIWKLVRW
jgi:DNA-binding SARP family transcriptional activator